MTRRCGTLLACVAVGLIMPIGLGWLGVLFDLVWLGAWATRDWRRGRTFGAATRTSVARMLPSWWTGIGSGRP